MTSKSYYSSNHPNPPVPSASRVTPSASCFGGGCLSLCQSTHRSSLEESEKLSMVPAKSTHSSAVNATFTMSSSGFSISPSTPSILSSSPSFKPLSPPPSSTDLNEKKENPSFNTLQNVKRSEYIESLSKSPGHVNVASEVSNSFSSQISLNPGSSVVFSSPLISSSLSHKNYDNTNIQDPPVGELVCKSNNVTTVQSFPSSSTAAHVDFPSSSDSLKSQSLSQLNFPAPSNIDEPSEKQKEGSALITSTPLSAILRMRAESQDIAYTTAPVHPSVSERINHPSSTSLLSSSAHTTEALPSGDNPSSRKALIRSSTSTDTPTLSSYPLFEGVNHTRASHTQLPGTTSDTENYIVSMSPNSSQFNRKDCRREENEREEVRHDLTTTSPHLSNSNALDNEYSNEYLSSTQRFTSDKDYLTDLARINESIDQLEYELFEFREKNTQEAMSNFSNRLYHDSNKDDRIHERRILWELRKLRKERRNLKRAKKNFDASHDIYLTSGNGNNMNEECDEGLDDENQLRHIDIYKNTHVPVHERLYALAKHRHECHRRSNIEDKEMPEELRFVRNATVRSSSTSCRPLSARPSRPQLSPKELDACYERLYRFGENRYAERELILQERQKELEENELNSIAESKALEKIKFGIKGATLSTEQACEILEWVKRHPKSLNTNYREVTPPPYGALGRQVIGILLHKEEISDKTKLDELYNRLYRMNSRNYSKLEADRVQNETKECTFSPEINSGSHSHRARSEEPKHKEKSRHRPGEIKMKCEMLYHDAVRVQRHREELKDKYEKQKKMMLLREKLESDYHFKRRVERDPRLAQDFLDSIHF